MSITIIIGGRKAKLAGGRWQCSDRQIAEVLNGYSEALEIPSHYPPQSREQLTAEAVVRDFGAKIIEHKPAPPDEDRMPDGRLIVY